MPHSRLGQQMFEQIARGRVEPLQIVKEQSQGMLGASEYGQETPEDQEKTSLRVLGRKLRERLLLADDKFQVRDQVHHKPAMWAQGFTERLTPVSEFDVALRQERTDKALKSLCQCGIGNVALVLIELARSKQAARRDQYLVQFVHNGGLADPGIAGHKHQFRCAALDDAVKRGEQLLDLARPSIQLLGDQQSVGCVLLAKWKVIDKTPRLP